MPESVEIPAPVSAAIRRPASTATSSGDSEDFTNSSLGIHREAAPDWADFVRLIGGLRTGWATIEGRWTFITATARALSASPHARTTLRSATRQPTLRRYWG